MVKFIGEDGYYPKWATQKGRWVFQRVLTTLDSERYQQLDFLARPPVSYEALVWAPRKKNLLDFLHSREVDADGAIHELGSIPLACRRCDWKGHHPSIEVSYTPRGAAGWRLRCPDCQSVVEPDFRTIDFAALKGFLVVRWEKIGRPALDSPDASRSLICVPLIANLADWIETWKPQENELIYVGQQLWPYFDGFMWEIRRSDSAVSITQRKPESLPNIQLICVSSVEPKMEYIETHKYGVNWSYRGDQWHFSAPALFNRVAYFGSGDGMVTALNIGNGRPIWKSSCPELAITRPIVVDDLVIAGCEYGVVAAFDADSGQQRWTYHPRWPNERVTVLHASDGKVFCCRWNGKCFALKCEDGKLLWEADLPSTSQGHVLGSLLITTIEEDDSFEITGLVATDCETGVNAWLYRFSSPIRTYALVERYLVYITDGIEETDLESRLVTLKVGDLNAREAPVEVTRTTIPKVDGVDQILIHDDCLYGRSFGELFKFERYLVYITDGQRLRTTDLESRLVTLKVGGLECSRGPRRGSLELLYPRFDGRRHQHTHP